MVLIWSRDSKAFLTKLPSDTLDVRPQFWVEQVPGKFIVGHFVRSFLQPFRHMSRLYLHFTGLGFEAIGAFFIWLETLRLNSRVPAQGMTFADRPQYGHWPYHQGTLGFGILLVGFLIAAFSIWLDHCAIHRNPSQISQ